MGILKFFKSLFSNKTSVESATLQSNNNDDSDNIVVVEKVQEVQAQKSVDQKLKDLKRKKYTHSQMSLANKLECETLNHLLSRESSSFNVYWDLYVPYGSNGDYMQIDFVVVTGETIYAVECKEYKTCTNIEVQGSQWKCYYNSGNVYLNANGVDQNSKHVDVLRKYIGDNSFDYKSVVALVVSDDFCSDINDEELIIVRLSEWEILFKMFDRRVKDSFCDECIGDNFVEVNEKIYGCMNVSQEIVEEHKRRIKEKYKN